MNKDLQGDLRQLIQMLLSMPEGSVRPANANQPNEGDDYAIMQVTRMTPTGWGTNGAISTQAGEAMITLDFFGKNSLHNASRLPMAMKSYYATNQLIGLNLGYMTCSDARDLTALEFERKSRHQVRLTLSYSITYEIPEIPGYEIGNIDIVDIELYVEP